MATAKINTISSEGECEILAVFWMSCEKLTARKCCLILSVRNTLNLCEVIRNIAGFDDSTNTFGAPTAAERIGLAVKGVARVVQSEGLQSGAKLTVEEASGFLVCFDNEWTEEVSTHARRTREGRQRTSIRLLPVTEDVQKLSKHIDHMGEKACEELNKNKADAAAYQHLRDASLVKIMTFNRRRQGEVSKIKVKEVTMTKLKPNDDVIQALSPFEKTLVNSLARIEIRGKRGRTVPVLLNEMLQKWLNKMMECRKYVGILESNVYLFARLGTNTHVRGADILRQVGKAIDTSRTDSLKSTLLRKHIATMTQILNLRENELDILANFMGHDIRVHRQYYRLPEETLQLAKVAKLLMAMESGSILSSAGKNLDDVDIQEDEEIVDDDVGDGAGQKDNNTSLECRQEKEEENTADHMRQTENSDLHNTGKKGQKRPWDQEEKDAVERHFVEAIRLKKLPGKAEIEACRRQEPFLQRRPWKNIKDYIRNRIAR